MNYGNYGYNPRFGGFPGQNLGAAAFYTPAGQIPQPAPQSAQTAFNGQMQGGFAVQPVTSREEALAVIADPMSPGVILPDLGHGVIYVKRFNPNTGASDFGEFAFVQTQQAASVETPEYLTRKEFDAALAQLRAELAPKSRRKEAADNE